MPNSDRKLEIVTEVPESAMVVFAHPDDAEIGSGGVIDPATGSVIAKVPDGTTAVNWLAGVSITARSAAPDVEPALSR